MLLKTIKILPPVMLGFTSMAYIPVVGPVKLVDIGFLIAILVYHKQVLSNLVKNKITHLFFFLLASIFFSSWLELNGFNGENTNIHELAVIVEMLKVGLGILMFTLVGSLTPYQRSHFMYGLIIGGLTISLLFIIELLLPSVLPFNAINMGTSGERAVGFLPDPNRFGMCMASISAICMGVFFSSGNKRWLTCALILIVTSLSSGSRGALLGILASSLIAFLIIFKSDIKTTGKYTVVGILILIVSYKLIMLINLENNYESMGRALSIVSDNDKVVEEESRLVIWSTVYDLWMNRPLFGYGLRGYRSRLRLSSHNSYLEILATGGIVSLVIYLLILFKLTLRSISYSIRTRSMNTASHTVLFLMIYLLLHSMFINIHFMLFAYGLFGFIYSYTDLRDCCHA